MIENVVSYSIPDPKILENRKYCVKLKATALITLTTITDILSLNATIKKYITVNEIIPPLNEKRNGREKSFALKKPPTNILMILIKKADTYSFFFRKYSVIELASPIFMNGIGKIINISSSCSIEARAENTAIIYTLDVYVNFIYKTHPVEHMGSTLQY